MSGEQLFINRPLPGAQINHSHPLAKGLVGCWLMNEQAGIRCIDSSPYGNHGTMVGFGVPANSRSSQGIKFDGVNDYIDCGKNSSLNNMNDVTVSAWVYPKLLTTSIHFEIVNKGGDRFYLEFYGSRVRASRDLDTTDAISYTVGGFASTNTWYNIVSTYNNSTKKTSIFINGLEIAYESQTTGVGSIINDSADNIYIGAYNGASAFFNGSINDVRIYNRSLNKDEAKELYLNPYAMFKR